MKDVTSTSFGYVIAFLLPGILGLFALASWFPGLGELLEPATSKDATLGPSFFLLLSCLTVGLIIGAARYYIFQKGLCRRHQLPSDIFKGLSGEKLVAFKAAVDEHYRYHQFYGGCAIALPILFCGWIRQIWPSLSTLKSCWFILVFIGFDFFLVITAMDAYKQYCRRSAQIVAQSQPEK